MSVVGTKRKCALASRDFRFWHLADISPMCLDFRFWGYNGHHKRHLRLPLLTQAVSKRRLTVLVSVAPCANGLSIGFAAVLRYLPAVWRYLLRYQRLAAANGSNEGPSQAGMACALIAAISGPIPIMLITRLRL